MPKLTTTSVSTSSGANYSTYSLGIPSTAGNHYIYHSNDINGTVFIAFGACLGFFFLILAFIWGWLSIREYQRLRKEYRKREFQSKYQFDPYYTSNGKDKSSSSSNSSIKDEKGNNIFMEQYSLGTYSDWDDDLSSYSNAQSDISEKVLMSKFQKHAKNNSLFISPTEILKQEALNFSSVSLDDDTETYSDNQSEIEDDSERDTSVVLPGTTQRETVRNSNGSNFQYIPKSSMINLNNGNSISFNTMHSTEELINKNNRYTTSERNLGKGPSGLLDEMLNDD